MGQTSLQETSRIQGKKRIISTRKIREDEEFVGEKRWEIIILLMMRSTVSGLLRRFLK
jgi:hypothetical protein